MHTVGLCVGDPPDELLWIASISHSFENGHHIFTSKAKHISGLFVADKDPEKASSQIVPAIQNLVWINLQQKVRVVIPNSLDVFPREHEAVPIKDTVVVIRKVG